MNDIKTEEIKSPEKWDRYVHAHGRSGYCHLFNWSRVINDAYHCKSLYLAALKQNSGGKERICGILPLYLFKKGFKKKALISIPFFDNSGLLADDAESETLLFQEGAQIFSNKRFLAMELRQDGRLKTPDMEIHGTIPTVFREKVGLRLGLQAKQQSMMAGFKSKLRSQIRKGEKNGLTWTIGKKELLDPFYAVFSRNMRDLGSPVHSKRFFNAIFTHFYHHAFICVVYFKSKPVAASFMFRFKNRLANPWASSIREFRHLNSNMFLYWQMIRFACNTGMAVFDMGRSSKGASTYLFKKQWEPVETPLYWYRWIPEDREMNRFNETLNFKPWKKLPLKFANSIGPVIRRHISL